MAGDVEGSIYLYAPSKVAPPVFAALFFVSFLWHVWQCVRFKAWKITGLHPLCALLFTVGFALRAYGTHNFDNVDVYITSTILIYTAPPLLELANYHVLGRILYYVPYFSPLHPGRTLTTFGSISFVVEILNALGVSLLARPDVDEDKERLGHILMKASLIIQVIVITCFVALAIVFNRRCHRGGIRGQNVNAPLITLYTSTALILIRTIYRIIEHFGQSKIPRNPPPDWDYSDLSPIVRYEWPFYAFEAGLMLSNSLMWNGNHPRRWLPEDYHIYLAQDGKTELLGPGWKNDQSFLMSLIDPCGLMAVFSGESSRKNGKKERPFWETNGFENAIAGNKPLDRQQSMPLVNKPEQQNMRPFQDAPFSASNPQRSPHEMV